MTVYVCVYMLSVCEYESESPYPTLTFVPLRPFGMYVSEYICVYVKCVCMYVCKCLCPVCLYKTENERQNEIKRGRLTRKDRPSRRLSSEFSQSQSSTRETSVNRELGGPERRRLIDT